MLKKSHFERSGVKNPENICLDCVANILWILLCVQTPGVFDKVEVFVKANFSCAVHPACRSSACAPFGKLRAGSTGTNLRHIPYPHLVTQPLRLPVAVDQPLLGQLAGLRIENRHLLPTRMKITTYNFH